MVVAQAASGEEAVERARQTLVDVALLDLHLPGMDGLEVLRRLKELQPEVEALLLTAHSSVETAAPAMKPVYYQEIRGDGDHFHVCKRGLSWCEPRR